ncbi:Aminopeptidase [Abortiporus biennis]
MASEGTLTLENVKAEDHRLPTDVKPVHYDLTIRTDLESCQFAGAATINLQIIEDTSSIVFNVLNLNIINASVVAYSTGWDVSDYSGDSLDVRIDVESERGIIDLPIILTAGHNVILKLGYEAEISGAPLIGYHRSAWQQDGKTKYYAVTRFQPIAARRAFPCWDEPLLKATYTVTMIHRKDTVALSNMDVEFEAPYIADQAQPNDGYFSKLFSRLAGGTTSDSSGMKITRFTKSPPMSTYLVAFANGPFSYIESSYTSPISGKVRPLRVYATPDLIHQAQFALDVTKAVMPRYERTFDIEYPLPKLDTIAASDYDAGALENWGLIIGRLNALLLDPENPDAYSTKTVAYVQTHEIAHQWFGNITTMAWWDTLYLNEGFATLMGSSTMLDQVFPEWKMNSYMVSEELNRAFDLDAKRSSHPIEVAIEDPKMLHQIFDMLAYAKAAAVLRMLSYYLGEDVFLKGVSTYLKSRLFKNGVTEDLWAGITSVTGIDVATIMDPWIKKTGFPVITVVESKDGISLRQGRFLESGSPDAEENETIWTIPLSLLTVSSDGIPHIDNRIVLDKWQNFIELDTTKPYKLNAGTVSFYRVLYPKARLLDIAKLAAQGITPFTPEDRIGLLSDALALAKAGLTETSLVLDLVDIFRNESEFYVWSSITSTLDAILDTWWEDQSIVDLVNKFRREIFGPMVKKLGYESTKDEPLDIKELRTLVISNAADANEESVVKELTIRFAKFLETGDDSHIPADLLKPTYITAARHGGSLEYDALKRIAENPATPSRETFAIWGLGAFTSGNAIEKTIDYALTEAKINKMQIYFVGLHDNFFARRLLAKKFEDKYDEVARRLEGTFNLQYLVQSAFIGLDTKTDYDHTQAFFKDKDTSSYKLMLNQTLDGILTKAEWNVRSTEDLRSWLASKNFAG